MQKTLIVYESRYGFTEDVAKKLALILGPAQICKTDEFKSEYEKFDFFVLESNIYGEEVDEKLLKFVVDNLHWLQTKKVALFCTSLQKGDEGIKYLNKIKQLLGEAVVLEKSLAGKITIDKLSEEDYNAMKSFSKKTGFPLKDVDISNVSEVISYGLELKRFRDSLLNSMVPDKLKFFVEEFLKSHNTCTLSTCCMDEVRGTPIEYIYNEGYIFFMTEGGEKFANLLRNNNVSISIYDAYENMTKIAGIQISGFAETLDYGSKEYKKVIDIKKIKYEQIMSLTIRMNIIRVKLVKAEFLYSKFKNMGFETKNIYYFDNTK